MMCIKIKSNEPTSWRDALPTFVVAIVMIIIGVITKCVT